MRPPARARPSRRIGAHAGGRFSPPVVVVGVMLAATIGGCGEVAQMIEPVTCWADKYDLQPTILEGTLEGNMHDEQGVWLRMPDGRRIEFGWPEEFRVQIGPDAKGAIFDEYGIEIVKTGRPVRMAGGLTPDGRYFTPCEINGKQYAWPPPPGH